MIHFEIHFIDVTAFFFSHSDYSLQIRIFFPSNSNSVFFIFIFFPKLQFCSVQSLFPNRLPLELDEQIENRLIGYSFFKKNCLCIDMDILASIMSIAFTTTMIILVIIFGSCSCQLIIIVHIKF